jgi:enoyl-CoA hydratase
MRYQAFNVEINDGVAHVIMNRPDSLNAMDGAFWTEIRVIFATLSQNTDVRVVVLSSTGKHFTAGMDLKFFGGMAGAPEGDPGRQREQIRRMVLEFQESFNAIERCRVPVLVAAHGACIGGGVDMVCASDMRYCSEDAYFTIQEIKIGMTADVGTLQRLPHLMPSSLVRELAFTGRKLRAAEALSSGFVSRVFEDHESLLAGVLEIAQEIASRSPLAVAGSKEMLNYTRDHSVADGLNYVATWNAAMLITEDLQEGMRAQAEKRPPSYGKLLDRRNIG